MLSEGRAIPRNPAAARRESLAVLQHAATRVLPRPKLPRRVALRTSANRWHGGVVALAVAGALTIAIEAHPVAPSVRGIVAGAQSDAVSVANTVERHVHPQIYVTATIERVRAVASIAAADVKVRLPSPAPIVHGGASTSPPTATTSRRLVVANTGGLGVNLRASPGLGTKVLRAWPDGTILLPTGAVAQASGRQWLRVRDPANEVGWVAAAYVVAR